MANLTYSSAPASALQTTLIIGELGNLKKTNFEAVSSAIGNTVTEKAFNEAVELLGDSDCIWLVPKHVSIATLSSKRSRNTTPTAAHHMMEGAGKNLGKNGDANIVVVCQRQYVFACGVAVARAFPTYSRKSNEPAARSITVTFVTPDDPSPLTDQDIQTLSSTANAIRLAADIVDRPRNEMTCDDMVAKATEVAASLPGVKLTVIRGEDLAKGGFGGIYGVGKAASTAPALIVLSHLPADATKTIAWCGKGIMYDTGGFSIKTKTGMPGMKRDCGGAAGILGAFKAAVEVGFTQNLHAVLCVAENSVGPVATVPDDVHILYSGKSVEINNTDAEGRLVLGDGVAYARKDLKADIVLDMATLTGAQGITTGTSHAAVLSNSESWEKCAVAAGLISADMVFPIIFAPELHFQEFKSSMADMKNSVKDRSNAQCSCAGLFIGAHLFDDYSKPSNIAWIHVDMAYPVHVGERATGFGPALLLSLFGEYSRSNMLLSVAPSLPNDANNGKRPKN